ncbi:GNAT family N-acetyltransferase [Microlunatus sp. GCM10028923]|uniref:GNAT family N-acetyltransferase n=1 Tax=Microlunatus sp. GCM10028923 TaxID=3273400 RepID=UPI0036189ABB
MIASDPRSLWLRQLRLEGKELDADGRLVRLPGVEPDPIPDCAVTRFADHDELSFSSTADAALLGLLRGVDPSRFFTASDDAWLTAHRLSVLRCSTYRFAEPVAAGRDGPAEVVRRGPESFTVIADGTPVAWAESVRSDDESAELWVHTDPAHLRRGYASRAATAWAVAITGSGRTAFYSHLAANEPSRRLARSLGVTHLFELAALTAEP